MIHYLSFKSSPAFNFCSNFLFCLLRGEVSSVAAVWQFLLRGKPSVLEENQLKPTMFNGRKDRRLKGGEHPILQGSLSTLQVNKGFRKLPKLTRFSGPLSPHACKSRKDTGRHSDQPCSNLWSCLQAVPYAPGSQLLGAVTLAGVGFGEAAVSDLLCFCK